jgi:hypothetical protein
VSKPIYSSDWGRFSKLEDTTRYRLIWRSYGKEKTGKDHFGLTAPGPIAIQSFDIGLEGVVEKFIRVGKDIRAADYEYSEDATQQEAKGLLAKFIADYKAALVVARTIIWDTETELWELMRFAEFGENNDGVATDRPKNYTKINGAYRDLVQLAYKSRVNLQLIQKVKERWGSNEKGSPVPTGKFEPTGMKEAGYIVQVNLQHTWDAVNGFGIDVLNCRQNMGIAGTSFHTKGENGLELDFSFVAQLVFPDSAESDWS